MFGEGEMPVQSVKAKQPIHLFELRFLRLARKAKSEKREIDPD
jgi:hypothetical protein